VYFIQLLCQHKQAVAAQNSDACSTHTDTVSKCDDTTTTTTTTAGTTVVADTAVQACSNDAETLNNGSESSSECTWCLQSVTTQERFQRLLAALRNAQVCNVSACV
jgi:hypothetical protein